MYDAALLYVVLRDVVCGRCGVVWCAVLCCGVLCCGMLWCDVRAVR